MATVFAATRFAIDADSTIKFFMAPRFEVTSHSASTPNFFVSGSDICDVPLVPTFQPANTPTGANVPTYTSIASSTSPANALTNLQSYWAANLMTGDNSLERPYTFIYPRVTTQSNIFTVHVRAQSLKKIGNSASQNVWDETRDQVTGEFRGSFTIEKYFDPNTSNITIPATTSTDPSSGKPQTAASDGTIATLIGTSTPPAVRGLKWRVLGMKKFAQ